MLKHTRNRQRTVTSLLALIGCLVVFSNDARALCDYPDAIILLDKSGSMKDNGKWAAAKSAIEAMLNQHQSAIRFGLLMFPSDSNCGVGNPNVSPAVNNKTAILNVVNPISLPSGNTPIFSGLAQVKSWYASHNTGQRKFVILISDGGETCHADKSNSSLMADHLETKVTELANIGVTTFVIGFGAGVAPLQLNHMAKAGGVAPANCNKDSSDLNAGNNCYINVSSSSSALTAALNEIARQISTEICDGKDNDCNGIIDDVVGKNDPCSAGVGECLRTGVKVCNTTTKQLVCNAVAANPTTEICDGKDNNCNGTVDDVQGLNVKCSAGAGACKSDGKYVCDTAKKQLVCNAVAKKPTAEVCDGIDNNCDGKVDEGLGLNSSCSVGTGECARTGVLMCGDDGGTTCSVNAGDPVTETCDGKDNDCDGAIDNGFDVGAPCTVGFGPCARTGVKICSPDGTGTVCSVVPDMTKQSPEVCDGVDNNCDGQVDENLTQKCSNACGDGTETCKSGKWIGCTAPLPSPEVCDGKDNDCNGKVDDGLNRPCTGDCSDGVESCKEGKWVGCTALNSLPEGGCGCKDGDKQECGSDTGICKKGTQTCTDRLYGTCQGEVAPQKETCNGLDDNCDGVVDNGDDLCEKGSVCFCGTCAKPCTNGECFGGGVCSNGLCLKDACGSGQKCDFASGQCKENKEQPPTTTTTVTNEDGSTTTTNEDGSTKTIKLDGTVVVTGTDGSTTTTQPDGTVVVTSTDGSTTTTQPDGTVTTTPPQGNETGTTTNNDTPNPDNGSVDPLSTNNLGSDQNGSSNSGKSGGCQLSPSATSSSALWLLFFSLLLFWRRERAVARQR